MKLIIVMRTIMTQLTQLQLFAKAHRKVPCVTLFKIANTYIAQYVIIYNIYTLARDTLYMYIVST
jgi:hypothetical protein